MNKILQHKKTLGEVEKELNQYVNEGRKKVPEKYWKKDVWDFIKERENYIRNLKGEIQKLEAK